MFFHLQLFIFEIHNHLSVNLVARLAVHDSSHTGSLQISRDDTHSHSDVIIELSTQISEQEAKIQHLQAELNHRDALIARLSSSTHSQSLLELEAEKASENVQVIAKELKKKIKRKKATESAPRREESTLSKDSGAEDLHGLLSTPHTDASNPSLAKYSFINTHQSHSPLDSIYTPKT